MCCVGTKRLLSDYDYVLDRFIELDALSQANAVSFAELKLDCSEHLFARDNFMTLTRCGDIARFGEKYFLAKDRRREDKKADSRLTRIFSKA